MQGKVGVVGWVVWQVVTPGLEHVIDFGLKARHFVGVQIIAACNGFVMVQLRERCPDGAITRAGQADTKVHVIESNGKIAFV